MPDRITDQNVIWFVQEHHERLEKLENRTENLNVIRRDMDEMAQRMTRLERKIEAVDAKADGLRKMLIQFSLSVAGSAVIFGISVLALLK